MGVLDILASIVVSFVASFILSIFGYNYVPPEPFPDRGFLTNWAGVLLVVGVCLFFLIKFENVQVSFSGVEARVRAIERKQKKWDKKRTRLMNFI